MPEQNKIELLLSTFKRYSLVTIVFFLVLMLIVLYLLLEFDTNVFSYLNSMRVQNTATLINSYLAEGNYFAPIFGVLVSVIVLYTSLLLYVTKREDSPFRSDGITNQTLSTLQNLFFLINFLIPIPLTIYLSKILNIANVSSAVLFVIGIFVYLVYLLIRYINSIWWKIEFNKRYEIAIAILFFLLSICLLGIGDVFVKESLILVWSFVLTGFIGRSYANFTGWFQSYKSAKQFIFNLNGMKHITESERTEWLKQNISGLIILPIHSLLLARSQQIISMLIWIGMFVIAISFYFNLTIYAIVYLALCLLINVDWLNGLRYMPKGPFDIYLSNSVKISKAIIVDENYESGYMVILQPDKDGQIKISTSQIICYEPSD